MSGQVTLPKKGMVLSRSTRLMSPGGPPTAYPVSLEYYYDGDFAIYNRLKIVSFSEEPASEKNLHRFKARYAVVGAGGASLVEAVQTSRWFM